MINGEMSNAPEITTDDLRKLAEVAGGNMIDPPGGCKQVTGMIWAWFETDHKCAWTPHEDIGQAFEVVEGLRAKGWLLNLGDDFNKDTTIWRCSFHWLQFRQKECSEEGETPAAAICLAALKCLEEANKDTEREHL